MNRLHWWWMRAQAVVWMLAGRSQQAVAVFDAMALRFPGDSYPVASRAHVLAQAGRHEEALAEQRPQ